ncbi:transcriptional regulator [Brevibacterium sp. XM4083]|uniref:winged helix-turn-helix domain-containing protein n=1 Tax=Brevibacterium sp. XM4083 TaxID=2583238 RepID=UPI00112D3732|nr:transcriptional regulator [Brevibacterium sp. XM4083]MCM1013711.1 transcriptional regulator [Brevibacterium sp. XM4083]
MTPSTAPTDGTGADSESAPEETIPHLGETLSRIDPDLGNPTRLGLVASLKNRDRAEFKLLRDSLGVSDSVLSRHITALEKAGLVEVAKGYVGKRPRTWVSITKDGAARLDGHVEALRELAGGR